MMFRNHSIQHYIILLNNLLFGYFLNEYCGIDNKKPYRYSGFILKVGKFFLFITKIFCFLNKYQVLPIPKQIFLEILILPGFFWRYSYSNSTTIKTRQPPMDGELWRFEIKRTKFVSLNLTKTGCF